MSFPLHIAGRTLATPAELGELARADARPGGTVVAGQRTAQWIEGLVRGGSLDHALAVGLCAALLRHPDAATIAEGARLAAFLGDPGLGTLILHALDGHDTGLLLEPDPGETGRSVEDALLRSAARIGDLGDPDVRTRVLTRLRLAALRVEEAQVLATWGSPDEIAQWMPALLTEGLPPEAAEAVARRIALGGEAAAALDSALRPR